MLETTENEQLNNDELEETFPEFTNSLMDTPACVKFVQAWADENNLEFKRDIYHVLTENRRNAFALSALKRGYARGNCSKWGYLAHRRTTSGKPLYERSVVLAWLETSVKPILLEKSSKKEAA